MANNTVTSDEHDDVKLTNGTLSSDRLRITEGGDVIRFEGNVVMHLDKMGYDAQAAAPQAPAEPAPPPKTRAPQNKSANPR
jgi:lipopolysaccharide export system protein LptC